MAFSKQLWIVLWCVIVRWPVEEVCNADEDPLDALDISTHTHCLESH